MTIETCPCRSVQPQKPQQAWSSIISFKLSGCLIFNPEHTLRNTSIHHHFSYILNVSVMLLWKSTPSRQYMEKVHSAISSIHGRLLNVAVLFVTSTICSNGLWKRLLTLVIVGHLLITVCINLILMCRNSFMHRFSWCGRARSIRIRLCHRLFWPSQSFELSSCMLCHCFICKEKYQNVEHDILFGLHDMITRLTDNNSTY